MEIWIGRDGERHGPYKEDDVRQWLRSGQVSRDDLGWYEGLADWQPLSVLFADEVPTTPPPFGTAAPAAALPSTTLAELENYAGFWQRFGAWVIDYLILLVPSSIIAISMGAKAAFEKLMTQIQNGMTPAAMGEYVQDLRPATLIVIALGFAYYVIFESSKWQATPGKLAMGLRVTDSQGMRISIGRSAARNAIRLINAITGLIPLIFYLPVAWTRRKQGLHDMIAGTLVLNGRAGDFKPAPTPAAGGGNTFSA